MTDLLRRIWAWRWWATFAVLAWAVLWYGAVPQLLGPQVPVARVVRTDLIATVVASGNVAAPYRVNIAAQIVGVVSDVPVAEGQTVKAGDVLIRLDDREAKAAVVLAEGALAQADARMRQLRELTLPAAEASLTQAQATLVDAQKTFDRAATLNRNGYETRANLDDATRALDIARAQLRNAELVVFTNRPDGSDYVMAETQRRQAQANLETARSRLTYTTITAPRDGVLIARSVERGFVVQPGAVLMVLSPFDDTQLVVQIDEKNLGRLALGQPALASADAFPDQRFPADLVYINPGIDITRASVEVKLHVPTPPAYLRQDMTVSVDIETARRPQTLVLPLAAIRDLGSPTPSVLKLVQGRAVAQPVKLGIIAGGKAEVLDGLTAGDTVLATRNPAIAPGARVRAAP